jgi:hypothetical protein
MPSAILTATSGATILSAQLIVQPLRFGLLIIGSVAGNLIEN